MRDIAEQLAFLALRRANSASCLNACCKGEQRKFREQVTNDFEQLLSSLPEGTIK